MDAVGFSESAPPLYYALAWLWTQLTGTGEFGLRSLSALAGVATVPVAYLLGAELRDRRAGIVAAAPGRGQPDAALVLAGGARLRAARPALTRALAALLRARRSSSGRRRDFTRLGRSSRRWRWRPTTSRSSRSPSRRSGCCAAAAEDAVGGLWIVAVAGLLAGAAGDPPDVATATPNGSATSRSATGSGRPGSTFTVGEIGDIIARPERPLLALVPVALVVGRAGAARPAGRPGRARGPAAVAAGHRRRDRRDPARARPARPGKDYVLARNLLPALVPLLVAVAIGVTLRRRPPRRRRSSAPRWSPTRSASASGPASRRPCSAPTGTRSPAELGEPEAPRAMVTWTLGQASLRYYLSTGSFQVASVRTASTGTCTRSTSSPTARRRRRRARMLGPGFRAGRLRAGRAPLHAALRAARAPAWRRCACASVRDADLNFRTNGVLLDGIGPGADAA